MAATRIWIKNPLAIFTANNLDAAGGLVIEDGVISELLKASIKPSPAPGARWSISRCFPG